MEHTTALPSQRRSRQPQWISHETLRSTLSVGEAITALRDALAGADPADSPARMWFGDMAARLAVMPAVEAAGGIVKLVTVRESNRLKDLPVIQGVYVIFEKDSLTPAALVGGQELTALRTPAVSGLATSLLAREDANHLVVFGSGVQARGHVAAVRAVRDVERVTVVARSDAGAAALVADLASDGVRAERGTPDDVRTADIVCTCTTAGEPLFDGTWLPAGVHVNAIGAYTPDTRELDSAAVTRARVVVERSNAAFEAGDLAIPLGEGAIGKDHVVTDLVGLVRGAEVRRTRDDITVFKSVGMAFEDVIIAEALVSRLGS